jgi:hypothetical protein
MVKGSVYLVCGRLAEFVHAQLSGDILKDISKQYRSRQSALAELARLTGQGDPYADGGRDGAHGMAHKAPS